MIIFAERQLSGLELKIFMGYLYIIAVVLLIYMFFVMGWILFIVSDLDSVSDLLRFMLRGMLNCLSFL